jgi:hypothetical protein
MSSTIHNIDRMVGVMYMARVCCQVETEVPYNMNEHLSSAFQCGGLGSIQGELM